MENNSRPTQPHQKDDVCIHKTEAPGPIGPLLQWDHQVEGLPKTGVLISRSL